MKTLKFKNTNDFYSEFALSAIEMSKVRGGDGADPIIKPPLPPIKI
jgi:hypothetical protein